MRNLSEVLLAEAGELPDAHFRTNVQAEILCTGDTFRVRGRRGAFTQPRVKRHSFTMKPLLF